MGLALLGDLARQRSLASAALLFLILVDEMEGLAFIALGVIAHRPDLFIAAQDALFPAIVMVAGIVSVARNWRRRKAEEVAEPVEMLDAAALVARIGDPLPEAGNIARASAISLYGLSHVRTSRPGSRSTSR